MNRYEITLDVEIGDRRMPGPGLRAHRVRPPGTTRLLTPPFDQAGLHGLLRRVRDAGLGLVAVIRMSDQPDGDPR